MLTLKWLHSASRPDGLDGSEDGEDWLRCCVASRMKEIKKNAKDSSPHGALFHWVHGRTLWTVENTGELVKLGHAANDSAVRQGHRATGVISEPARNKLNS